MWSVPGGLVRHAHWRFRCTESRRPWNACHDNTGRGGPRAKRWSLALVAVGATAGVLASLVLPAAASSTDSARAFRQVNLVSDSPGVAAVTDPDLVNSWGVSASAGTDQAPGGALWVSDNGKDKTTLYTSGTATTVSKAGLIVTITSGAPTGQVSNSDTNPDDFVVHDAAGHSGPAAFIFVSENGGIDGWNPGVGVAAGANPPSTVTEVARDNGANAVYKGLARPRRRTARPICTPPTSGPAG